MQQDNQDKRGRSENLLRLKAHLPTQTPSVEFIERNGVTEEQLQANTEDMEPKVIKEESIEKEVSSYIDTQSSLRTRSKTALASKDRCKTPDSPEGARLSQAPPPSPTQSSPVRPPTNGTLSPVHNGGSSADNSLTPPPVQALNSTVSGVANKDAANINTTTPIGPLSLSVSNLDHISSISHPHSYQVTSAHVVSNNNITGGGYTPAGHVTSALAAAAPLGRPLAKLKRFLGTLVQFGQDIGPDIGDRVRSLVLSLVSSAVTVEDFHHSLQDVTNFPLRPFVLPFLRAHLPPLQREVHALARAAKQTPIQYLRAHDHVILEPAHSPAEPSEIFLSTSAETPPAAAAVKRRASDALYENGLVNGIPPQPPTGLSLTSNVHDPTDYSGIPAAKRPYNFLMSHQSLLGLSGHVPHTHFFDYGQHGHTYNAGGQHRPDETSDPNRSSSRGDEEWRNIHVMLNCILSMVEKTKRALSILQQRNSQDLTSEWLRKQDVSTDLKKAAGEIMAQAVRQTEDRVAEVKRKAEEAVNDVKRQAVVELQKAVAAAEIKANELVANERAKMEKLLLEARKHSDEAISNHGETENSQSPPCSTQPAPSQQNSCWNCGRKAHETCSGCSIARYCGPFCQHKDWENHHQVCATRPGDKTRPQRTTTPATVCANPAPVSAAVNTTHAQIQETARLKK